MNRADRPPSPAEQLAQPTEADVTWRLGVDARQLAKRIDGYNGPVSDELDHELEMLAESIWDLQRHRS